MARAELEAADARDEPRQVLEAWRAVIVELECAVEAVIEPTAEPPVRRPSTADPRHGVTMDRDRIRAQIKADAATLRTTLSGQVYAIEDFDGFRPGGDGTAFSIRAGGRLPAAHPIVAKYPDRFRPHTDAELDRTVELWVRAREYRAGL